MNYGKEFQKYALSEGISSLNLHYFDKNLENSMTPYILEEREMRVTQMDIFSRLMRDRILWVAGVVNDNMSTIVQAQLMFLDNLNNNDITMHVDSPGGSVKSGFLITDIIKFIDIYIVLFLGYKGPEIPCLRIIKKCVNINTAAAKGKTNVCAL